MEKIISKYGNILVGITEPKEWRKGNKQRLKEMWDTTECQCPGDGSARQKKEKAARLTSGLRSEHSSCLVNNKSRKFKEFQAG